MSFASMAVRGVLLVAMVACVATASARSGEAEATGPIDLTGEWQMAIGGVASCPATITQGPGSSPATLDAVIDCSPDFGGGPRIIFYLVGTIETATGAFTMSDSSSIWTGTASKDSNTISGEFTLGGTPFGSFAGSRINLPPPPPSGLQFSIGIDVNGDTADDCDTRDGPAKCSMTVGSEFWLEFYLDDRVGFVYDGYDFIAAYAGVTPAFAFDYSPWPECSGTSFGMLTPSGPIGVACTTTTSSTYTGLMARVQFACAISGSISMLHGTGGTGLLVVGPGTEHEASSGSEALDINCVAPPTPADIGGLSFDPPTAAGAGATGPSVAAMVAAAAASAVVLGGAARYAGRRVRG